MTDIKQVIVIRKDLKCRRGKECAQSAHSSLAFLSHRINLSTNVVDLTDPQRHWLSNSFKKICLQVEDEAKLLEVYENAKKANLEVYMIEDSGLTEFSGQITRTCLAIGPDYSEKIDPVTRHLKLY